METRKRTCNHLVKKYILTDENTYQRLRVYTAMLKLEPIKNKHIIRTKMGRGDKKTRKGKISKGSYGNSRPRADKSPKNVQTEQKDTKIAEKKK